MFGCWLFVGCLLVVGCWLIFVRLFDAVGCYRKQFVGFVGFVDNSILLVVGLFAYNNSNLLALLIAAICWLLVCCCCLLLTAICWLC